MEHLTGERFQDRRDYRVILTIMNVETSREDFEARHNSVTEGRLLLESEINTKLGSHYVCANIRSVIQRPQ